MFDPYHKWLGIPKHQRPPTHYQLLGIAPGESDPEVIDEAAVRQTAHVRTYQIGQHAAECTRVLNEISQAKLSLLNPAKRKTYDEQLAKLDQQQFSSKPAVAAVMSSAPVAVAPAPSAFEFDESAPTSPPRPRPNLNIAKPVGPRSKALWIGVGAGGGLLVAVVAVAIVIVMSRSAPPNPVPPVAQKKDEGKPPPKQIAKGDAEPPKEVKPIVPKDPIGVKPNPPPAQVGPAAVNVAGARSFKSLETRIEWMSLSPDGTKVALGFLNPSVYDVETGKKLTMFPPRKFGGNVRTPVAFLPDNQRVLFAYGSDPAAAVGDSSTGQTLFHLEQDGVQYASAVAVDPTGKRALISYNYLLVYWDLENQKEIKSTKIKTIPSEVIFMSNGRGAVVADESGRFVIWDLDQFKPLRNVSGLRELRSLSVSSDGATIAAGSNHGVALFDAKTLQLRTVNNKDFNGAVALCSGGKQFLVGTAAGEIRLFETEGVKHLGTLRGHKAPITRIAVDAKERIAVSADASGTVVVWPLAKDGTVVAEAPRQPALAAAAPPGLKQISDKNSRIAGTFRVAILPDGKSFLAAGMRINRWDFSGTIQQEYITRKNAGNAFCLALSADGRVAAWGDGFDNPSIFEMATGRELGRIPRAEILHALAISNDGELVAAAFADRSLFVWDSKQRSVRELPFPDDNVGVTFSPDGSRLFVRARSGNVQTLETKTWQAVSSWTTGAYPRSMAFAPDGRTLAVTTANRGVRLFDATKLQPLVDFPDKKAQQVVFCAGSQLLLSLVPETPAISVWDTVQQTKIAIWELPEKIEAFAVDAQQTVALAVTRTQGTYHCYTWPLPKDRNGVGGQAAAVAPPVEAPNVGAPGLAPKGAAWQQGDALRTSANVEHVVFTPDGRLAALASKSGVSVWDWQPGREISAFSFPKGSVLKCLAISPDGKQLASGHVDHSRVILWDLEKGVALKQLNHDAPVTAVAFSADGKQLAAGGGHIAEEKAGQDCHVHLWNVAEGKPFKRFLGPERSVRTLAVAADRLVAEDQRGEAYDWNPGTGNLRAKFSTHSFLTPLAIIGGGRKLIGFELGAGRFLSQWDTARQSKDQLIDMAPTAQGGRPGFWCNRDGTLAGTSHPGEIIIWDLKAKERRTTLTIPREHELLALAFTGDSREVVAALSNETVVRMAIAKGD